MDYRTMRRLWIKAAVEHRILRLKYLSRGSDSDVTEGEVEPDFVGRPRELSIFRRGPFGFWAAFNRLRGEGPCYFEPVSIVSMELTDRTFEPRPDARWMEHLEEYHESDLRDETF